MNPDFVVKRQLPRIGGFLRRVFLEITGDRPRLDTAPETSFMWQTSFTPELDETLFKPHCAYISLPKRA